MRVILIRILVAGPHSGKTYLALVEVCQAAWKPTVWYGMWHPHIMAKRIFSERS